MSLAYPIRAIPVLVALMLASLAMTAQAASPVRRVGDMTLQANAQHVGISRPGNPEVFLTAQPGASIVFEAMRPYVATCSPLPDGRWLPVRSHSLATRIIRIADVRAHHIILDLSLQDVRQRPAGLAHPGCRPEQVSYLTHNLRIALPLAR